MTEMRKRQNKERNRKEGRKEIMSEEKEGEERMIRKEETERK